MAGNEGKGKGGGGGGNETLSQQLSLAKELNNVLRQQSKILSKIDAQMGAQSKLISDLNKAGRGRVDELKGQSDRVSALTQSIQGAKEASRSFTDELKQGLKDAQEEGGGLRGVFGGIKNFLFSWKGGVLAIFGGIGAAVAKLGTSIVSVFKGAFSLVQSLAKGAMGIVQAVIAAPFKMMDAVVDVANKLREITVVINGAQQAAKGMIGNFKEVGSATKKGFDAALAATKKLPPGLFGPREQGTAERIQLAAEMQGMLSKLGEGMDGLTNKGKEAALLLHKAFKYTAEDFRAMIIESRSSGKSMSEIMQNNVQDVKNLSTATDINTKDMAESHKKFSVAMKFSGQSNREQIFATTLAFTKLGVTSETAMAMVSKFDTLEGGAEAVSSIARNFGVFIDQNEMMAAQDDPSEMLRIYQKKFAEAGVEYDDMSRHRRLQLAKDTNINDPQSLAAIFGGGGEDAIKKALKKAKANKDANNLPKIMRSVAKSIKGVADSIGPILKPFAAFIKGLTHSFDDKFAKAGKDIMYAFEGAGRTLGEFLQKNPKYIKEFTTSISNFAKKITEIMPDILELFRVLFGEPKLGDKSATSILEKIAGKIFSAYQPIVNKGITFIATIVGKIAPFVIKSFGAMAEIANEAFMSFLGPEGSGDVGGLISKKFGGLTKGMKGIDPETDTALKDAGKSISSSWDKTFGSGSSKMRKVFSPDGTMKEDMMSLGSQFAGNFINSLSKLGSQLGSLLADALVAALSDWRVIAAFALLMSPVGSLKLLGKGAQFLGRGVMSAGRGIGNLARGTRGASAARSVPKGRMAQWGAKAAEKGARASQAVGQFAARTMPTLTKAAGTTANVVANTARGMASVTRQTMAGVTGALKSSVGTTNAIRASATGLTKGVGVVVAKAGLIGAVATVGMGIADGISEYKKSGNLGKAGEAMGQTFLSGVTFGLVDKGTTEDMRDSFYESLVWMSGEQTEKEIQKRMAVVRNTMVNEIRKGNKEVLKAREIGNKMIKAQSVDDLKDLIKQDRMGLIKLSDEQVKTYKKLIGQQSSVQEAMAAARTKVEKDASDIQRQMTKLGNVITEAKGFNKEKGYEGAEDHDLEYAGDLMQHSFLKTSSGKGFIDKLLTNMRKSDEISGSEMKEARAAVARYQRYQHASTARDLKKVVMSVLDGHINDNGTVEFDDSDEMKIFFEAAIAEKKAATARKQAKLNSMEGLVAKAQREAMGGVVKWSEKELLGAIEVFGKESDKGVHYVKALRKKKIEAESDAIAKLIYIALKSRDKKEFMRLTGKTIDEAIKEELIYEHDGKLLTAYGLHGRGVTQMAEASAKYRADSIGDKFLYGDSGKFMQEELKIKTAEIADSLAKAKQFEEKQFKIFSKKIIGIYKRYGTAAPASAEMQAMFAVAQTEGSAGLQQWMNDASLGIAGAPVTQMDVATAVDTAQKSITDDKALGPTKAAAKAPPKKKVGKVKVKPLKGAKDLAKLDPNTLRLLSNRWTVKNIRIRGGKIAKVLEKMAPAAEKVSDALQKKAGPAMDSIATKSAEATSQLATTVNALDLVRDRMADIAGQMAGIVTSVVKIKETSNSFKAKDKIKIAAEGGTIIANINVTMDAKTLASGLAKTGVVVMEQ